MTKLYRVALAILPLALATGCTDKFKAPAEAAIKAGEQAVETLKTDEVAQFAAGPAKAVGDALADAKNRAGGKDFEGALKVAQTIPGRAKDVLGQAAVAAQAAEEARKAAALAAWQDASKAAQQALDAAHTRLAALKKKPVKTFDKKALASANGKYAELEGEWVKVGEKFKAGGPTAVEEATAAAKDLAIRVQALATSLPAVKVPPPPPAKAKPVAKAKTKAKK
jgi:hypothetical protein